MGDTVPSDRELEILKALWELGSASVREVHQRMCPGGELHFNTVQTLLRIMEEKGLVGHRSEGRAFVYFPLHSREQVTAHFLQKVFDGAVDQLVLSLLQASEASAEELKDLEKLIAQARRRKQGGRKEGD